MNNQNIIHFQLVGLKTNKNVSEWKAFRGIHTTAYLQDGYVTRLHFKANFSFGLHVQKKKVRAVFSTRTFTFAYLRAVGQKFLPLRKHCEDKKTSAHLTAVKDSRTAPSHSCFSPARRWFKVFHNDRAMSKETLRLGHLSEFIKWLHQLLNTLEFNTNRLLAMTYN